MKRKAMLLLFGVACFITICPIGLRAKTLDKVQIHLFIQMSQSEKEDPNSMVYQLVDQYNHSKENIELVLDITTASCSFDAADSLMKRIEMGNPPDISSLRYRELWDHYLDLTPFLTKSFLNSMDTTMFSAFRTYNRLVFLPSGYNNRLFYYNKKLFDSAGLAYPPHQYDVPYADGEAWDISKLEEIAGLLTLDNEGRHQGEPEFDKNNIIQYGFHWGWFNGIGMVQMFGPAQIITEDGNVALSDYTRQGYKWVYHAIREAYFAPDINVFMNIMDERPIQSGKCAMMLSYVNNARILQSTSVDWDIAALPSCNGNYYVPWGIGGSAILESCSHPAEAMEVIMDMINMQDLYAATAITIPVKKDIRKDILSIWSKYYPGRNLQVILDGFDHRSIICDGQGVQFRMGVWRLVNDFRDYLWQDPDAQVDGAIDTWLIPSIEAVLKTTDLDERSVKTQPEQFQLFQNYPNPFNPSTKIKYWIDKPGHVQLKVFNIYGQEVEVLVNSFKQAGEYTVTWEPNSNVLSSGVYLCGLRTDNQTRTTKLIYSR